MNRDQINANETLKKKLKKKYGGFKLKAIKIWRVLFGWLVRKS